tara:strand:- start:53 stop:247 length:195 start_codon:yes stop_codon:yes gene_type:complete
MPKLSCGLERPFANREIMKTIDAILDDPVIQLVIIVIVTIGVFDAFKFALSWVWKKIGGHDESG